jgi:membrane protein implicated in regulation of membrane protease activity
MHNKKYRYLALATMVATALYLFIVDLARVEIVFRVVAFLFLAILSIVLSLYYTKRRNKKPEYEN